VSSLLPSLEPVDLIYTRDVRPLSAPVREYQHLALTLVALWKDRSSWNKYVDSYWGGGCVYGKCYQAAVSLCALMRYSGHSHSECLVIVTSDKHNALHESLHATVLALYGGNWLIVDPTKPTSEEGIWVLEDAQLTLSQLNIWCVFNDRVSLLQLKPNIESPYAIGDSR